LKTKIAALIIILTTINISATQVTGFVFNSDSTEIVYSDVEFTNINTGQSYESFTSWSGYSVNIPSGTYNVQVTDIFNLYEVGNFGPYEIPDSNSSIEMNFFLNLIDFSGVDNFVTGIVKDDSSSAPIQGAEVILLLDNNISQTLLTDENGSFTFENLLPVFNYSIIIFADGYLSYSNQFVVNDSTQLELNVNLTPAIGSNTSRVFGEVTSSFFPDLGIEDVKVDLINILTGNIIQTTNTDAQGGYSFDLVERNSNYVIEASKLNYSSFVSLILVSEQDLEFNFDLTPDSPEFLGFISGNISFSDGTPLQNAIVSFFPADSSDMLSPGIVLTDINGDYTQALTPGSYYVQTYYIFDDSLNFNFGYIIGEFYDNAATIADATIIEVVNDQTVPNIDFVLETPEIINATISGTVKDNNDQPIADARITVMTAESNTSFYYNDSYAVTDVDGNYTAEVTAISNNNGVKVKASTSGYYAEYYEEQLSIFDAEVIEITDNASITDINFTLTPFSTTDTLTLSGSVSDNQGFHLSNVFVFVFGLDGTFNLVLTDSLGNYSFTTLTEGNYYIYFVSSGYVPVFYENAINWEDASLINLTSNLSGINAQLNPVVTSNMPGVVNGYAKDYNNKPLAGVTIMVMNSSDEVIGYSLTDENGYYSIAGLGNGQHEITASELFYASEKKSARMNLSELPVQEVNFTLVPVMPTNILEENSLPDNYELSQNYPNPFNPTTTIQYSIPVVTLNLPGRQTGEVEVQNVTLRIYDILGSEVATLVNENQRPGNYRVEWNADNYSSGVYYYKLTTSNFTETKKMILLR
jgi:hypothetical protein